MQTSLCAAQRSAAIYRATHPCPNILTQQCALHSCISKAQSDPACHAGTPSVHPYSKGWLSVGVLEQESWTLAQVPPKLQVICTKFERRAGELAPGPDSPQPATSDPGERQAPGHGELARPAHMLAMSYVGGMQLPEVCQQFFSTPVVVCLLASQPACAHMMYGLVISLASSACCSHDALAHSRPGSQQHSALSAGLQPCPACCLSQLPDHMPYRQSG